MAKAGSTTSSAPIANPTGKIAAAMVRTPGAASAPRMPPKAGVPRVAREAGSAANQSVPASASAAAASSAAAGEKSATSTPVSSGPRM